MVIEAEPVFTEKLSRSNLPSCTQRAASHRDLSVVVCPALQYTGSHLRSGQWQQRSPFFPAAQCRSRCPGGRRGRRGGQGPCRPRSPPAFYSHRAELSQGPKPTARAVMPDPPGLAGCCCWVQIKSRCLTKQIPLEKKLHFKLTWHSVK